MPPRHTCLLLSLASALLALTGSAQTPPATVTLRLGDRVRAIPGPLGQSGERVQVGGRRAEPRDGRWAFSDDRVLQEITAAAAFDGRFVFVAEDGLVAASDTFLGALRPLGAVAGARRASSHTRGRLAVLSDDALATTDGASLTPAGPTPAPARHASFLDARTGAAVLADGALVLTRDGAATWTPVALGRDLALSLAFRGGALRVLTTRGTLTLGPDGALAPAPPLREARAEAPALGELVAAWRAREPVPDHGDTGNERLPDGTYVAVTGGAVRHVDAAGRVLSERTLGPACEASAWPGGVGVHCGDLYRTTDGETWEAVPGPPGRALLPTRQAVFAADGVGVAVRGACDVVDLGESAPGLCVRDASGRWRDLTGSISAGEGYLSIAGMRGADLLVDRFGPASALFLVDLATGSAQPVTFDGVPAERVAIEGAHLAADGAYVAVVRTATRAWYARGEAGAAWRAVALPEGARSAGFADAQRGLALGARFGELWRTLDGGARWEPVPVGLTFSGEAHRLRSNVPVACDARGCSAGGFLFVRGWGPVQPPAERVLAGAARPEEPRGARPSLALAPMRCARAGASASPWRADATRAGARGRAFTADHLLTVERRGGRVRVVWRGDGGGGEASFTEAPDDPLQVPLGFAAGALVATRGGLHWARGATRTPLPLPPALASASGGADRWLTVPAPGGGLLALSAPAHQAGPEWADDPALHPLQFAVAFELSAGGAVLGQRAVAPDLYGRWHLAEGLGRVGGRAGYVTVTADRAVTFAPVGGGAATAAGTLPEVLRPCEAAPDRAAHTLWLRSAVFGFPLDAGRAEEPRVAVELSPTGACVRAVAGLVDPFRGAGRHEHIALRAEGGALVGAGDDGETRHALRCEVTP